MVDLEKRITGDWIDLRERLNDLLSLLDLLKLPPADLKAMADRLRLCVEQGIVEFKRSSLSPILAVLEMVRYKSLALEEIAEQQRSLTLLLLAVLVQRLIAMELVPMARGPQEEKRDFGIGDMQVNVILSDVNAKLKSNPSLRAHPAIKNILMQVQVYKRENAKLKELLPTIKQEMRTSFLGNFTKAFADIIASIRKQYLSLLQEEEAARENKQKSFSLALVPLRELNPLLMGQAKEFSRMRSTLAHARDEKYKTREILVRLYDERHDAVRMIEEELKVYKSMCRDVTSFGQEACVAGIADGFRQEIMGLLEKQLKWETPVT
jgi:hypothetical protein